MDNLTGAEAAARRLRATPERERAATVEANPDSAQLPVRQVALEDGRTVYMAVPRLAETEPFFLLDPPVEGIRWDELTDEKNAAIPLLAALRRAADR